MCRRSGGGTHRESVDGLENLPSSKVTSAFLQAVSDRPIDTPSPLGRGSRHAPNKLVCQLRRGTVVAFLLVLPVGTDQARFELRLQPQLDTPSPLGRGSSHAPNKPVRLLRRGTVLSFRWALTSAASSL